jgi:uncharacterized damage-inducible protein DinB
MNRNTFQLLAQYNIWATRRLCNNLSIVSDEDFHQDVGLYFKSISGTLNHLLLGEHELWYPRFKHGISPILALNTILHTEKKLLLDDLVQKSHNWIEFIDQLDEKKLTENFSYRRASGQAMTLPYAATLFHVFNHGTHHRGQVTAAMTHLGYTCPELDLVYMLAEKE